MEDGYKELYNLLEKFVKRNHTHSEDTALVFADDEYAFSVKLDQSVLISVGEQHMQIWSDGEIEVE